jgi:hypothetical protein
MGLLGGGDGETVECFDAMTQGPLICADVSVVLDFSVESQAEVMMRKAFRFATALTPDGFHWFPQPLSDKQQYCGPPYRQ